MALPRPSDAACARLLAPAPLLLLASMLLLALSSCVDRTAVSSADLRSASGPSASGPSAGTASRTSSRPSARAASRPSTPASERSGRPLAHGHDPALQPRSGELRLPDPAPYSELLAAIVRGPNVDYAALQERTALLDRYLEGVRRAQLAAASSEQKLAFYINAYNAWTLRLVLDRVLPAGLGSVLEAQDFFERDDTVVAGERLSLNAIEKRALALGEPRVHFAVNCASRSCPPLQPRPWEASTLEADLARATRAYFASEHGAVVRDGRVLVTQLLEWYAQDWGGPKGARNFVMRYAPRSIVDRLPAELEFIPYDWALNRP